jgi:SAM-dependent methyltransferase
VESEGSSHLDFGCGSQPRNPFGASNLISVDVAASEHFNPTSLINPGDRLPFPDATFTSLSAYDVLEHLSRDSRHGNDFIFYMKEFYRVLKPGGICLLIFPAFPHEDAFSDPTHVNFITAKTLDYFVNNQNPPYYAEIDTNFQVILNNPLRVWNKWVTPSVESAPETNMPLRRKLSLAKRTASRFLVPQHRLWLIKKAV